MILLDTHVWLWWLLGEGTLDEEEREVLDEHASNGEIMISAATIWELELLEKEGKVDLKPDFETWITRATDSKICTVIPIDTDIILAQKKLSGNFPNDPADRLIVATALAKEIPLATKNEALLNLGF